MEIIGRKKEINEINYYLDLGRPEFIAVYGRRRVGKTFLVRELLNDKFIFYLTGVSDATRMEQLNNFNIALNDYSVSRYPKVKDWIAAFEQLKAHIKSITTKGRKVIFLDELPWLDTPKSGFLKALEHFWNSYASANPDIVLIVCGSATTWMINKLINNKGGLYNRVTRQIKLKPFNLAECEEYYSKNGIVMNRTQMLESYMILGGVPYYLSLLSSKLSLAQNIDGLFFAEDAPLKIEFDRLYASLFKDSEKHIEVVHTLSQKSAGMTREDILSESKLSGGGTITNILTDLESSGFIRKYHAFKKKKKDAIYQLTDFYTLFYFRFAGDDSINDEHYWSKNLNAPKINSWRGYAFEQVCFSHVNKIYGALGISGITTSIFSWRSKGVKPGAQIDMLIDRSDDTINLCEMKYSDTEYVINNDYRTKILNKRNALVEETGTKKTIHIVMVTTSGVKRNEYSDIVQNEVTMNDLFCW